MPVTVKQNIKQIELKPPLKWAGGKRWLVPVLAELWQKYSAQKQRRLVEPLCGGIAITLGLTPERALLNDINPHAINFYNWLKKGLRTNLIMRNDEKLYYQYRERFNELITLGKENSKEAAILFYYLNRTGYNGLCRFNKQGEFNVPFGQYKKINYVSDFSAYHELFSDWDFTIGDFSSIELATNDFVYADPPYDVEFTQYAKEGFNFQDQQRLAKWLSKHKGPVVVSNQATERMINLYEKLGFKVRLLSAPRRISCTGDRTPARELLALKGI
jgi:DNA adenine methylase